MRILLTGASSFTGCWFAEALAAAGHSVIAPLRQSRAAYAGGIKARRLERLAKTVELVGDHAFGTASFVDLVRAFRPDVLCHHAARVGDYRSPEFDIAAALAENTNNLRAVLEAFHSGGGRAVILTGSVVEPDEGAGTEPRVAFSAYGVSKAVTATVVAHRAREAGLAFGKFTIPNPFGPLEEPRFCAYLVRNWKAGETARVNTPDYIRDNIHVDLLARAYVRFIDDVIAGRRTRLNPSGYVESQGRFAERYAAALRARLDLPCKLEFGRQTDFAEPLLRINTDPASAYVGDWNEAAAWNGIAEAVREPAQT